MYNLVFPSYTCGHECACVCVCMLLSFSHLFLKLWKHLHINILLVQTSSPNSQESFDHPLGWCYWLWWIKDTLGWQKKIILGPMKKDCADWGKVTSWPGAKTKFLDTTNDSFVELLMRKPTRENQQEETLEPEQCFRHFRNYNLSK